MSETNNQIATVNEENYKNVIEEIQEAFFDIPFENSQFQTEMFVIASQITPARAYRAIGLRMISKLQALEEAKYNRMIEDIEIEEKKEMLNDPSISKWEKKKIEIEIERRISKRKYTNKLINDALVELNVLYKHFKALPKYTREQFEQEERLHFEQRLARQLQGVEGAKESLINMTNDSKMLKLFEHQYNALLQDESQQESTEQLFLEILQKQQVKNS